MKRHVTRKEVTKIEEVTEGYYLTRVELSRLIEEAYHCGQCQTHLNRVSYALDELSLIDSQAETVEPAEYKSEAYVVVHENLDYIDDYVYLDKNAAHLKAIELNSGSVECNKIHTIKTLKLNKAKY